MEFSIDFKDQLKYRPTSWSRKTEQGPDFDNFNPLAVLILKELWGFFLPTGAVLPNQKLARISFKFFPSDDLLDDPALMEITRLTGEDFSPIGESSSGDGLLVSETGKCLLFNQHTGFLLYPGLQIENAVCRIAACTPLMPVEIQGFPQHPFHVGITPIDGLVARLYPGRPFEPPPFPFDDSQEGFCKIILEHNDKT